MSERKRKPAPASACVDCGGQGVVMLLVEVDPRAPAASLGVVVDERAFVTLCSRCWRGAS